LTGAAGSSACRKRAMPASKACRSFAPARYFDVYLALFLCSAGSSSFTLSWSTKSGARAARHI